MHQMSLIGCPLTRIERPPFQHPFGPEVDFYQISEGEEWDNALNELEIAFFSTDALKGARFFVYWRTGGQVK
jgi:type VI secretion system protein ImpJ